MPQGSKTKIRTQDPAVIMDAPIKTILFSETIKTGPQNEYIIMRNQDNTATNISPTNDDGDFEFDPNTQRAAFDTVSTFSIIQKTIEMYSNSLKAIKGPMEKFSWQWGKDPISGYAFAGHDANAYYNRNDKAVKFFYFKQNKTKNNEIYTCESFDIVAHEVGHAILDGINPLFLESTHPESGAIHESFGDLTALFLLIEMPSTLDEIIVKSKGNLHARSFFNYIAEQFGQALGYGSSLRYADNNLTMQDISTEVHDLSQIFTGAMYDILVDLFNYNKSIVPDIALTQLLHDSAVTVRNMLVHALLSLKEGPLNFFAVIKHMYESDRTDDICRKFIIDQFQRRYVIKAETPANNTTAAAAIQLTNLNLLSTDQCSYNANKCCYTLKKQHLSTQQNISAPLRKIAMPMPEISDIESCASDNNENSHAMRFIDSSEATPLNSPSVHGRKARLRNALRK